MSTETPLPDGSPRARFALLVVGSLLLGGCGGGGDGGGDNGGGSDAPAGPVTISGKAQYQLPPPGPACQGLDFNAIELRPIRQATIELLAAVDDSVLDSGVTDDTGAFALTVDPQAQVYIRVRAELKRTGSPSWNVEVRDNTATMTASGSPLALKARPLYVLDTAAFSSGTADMTRNVTAATGWDGTSYTGKRAAAPFAILDTVYAGMLLVLGTGPETSFEPLDVFWSVNNRPADGNIDDGDITTSFYRASDNSIFLLGDASTASSDADEFDDHVVGHEWGHYFEDIFSRSDSIGGPHMLGDRLDMRLAFSEGWATALSGMVLASPDYCDTTLSRGFSIDIENGVGGTSGWFNEISVVTFVYDLWDEEVDGPDTGSLGFGPIHEVMTGSYADTPAFTSIYPFAEALKAENPAGAPLVQALLDGEDVSGTGAFGDGESNDAGALEDVLPVYTEIVPDGSTVNICSNSQFDRDGTGSLIADGNKLSEHRYLTMTITDPARYTFDIRTTTVIPIVDDPNNDSDQSDPDILILLNGERQNAVVAGDLQGFSGDAGQEIFTTPDVLQAGQYVMALVEFRYQDTDPPLTPDNYPARTCFDVSVSAAP
ncbi:MAG TPA: hypothetical protein VE175_09170 [Woeseiaceae bacterium]|jgi:hypothetical protein|nr:hypothetical protein [Woeseiaceae bacterium]